MRMERHAVQCAHCGTQFDALRSEAKYCSATCRVTASVQRRRPATPARVAERPAAEQVRETDRARFDRLLQKATEARYTELGAEFTRQLKAAIEGGTKTERARLEASILSSSQRAHEWQQKTKRLDAWLTEAEFKKVLGCLASDRQPEEVRRRFDEATIIFRRLKEHLSPTLPELRKNGWGKQS